ncbi:MAG: TlpA family protein disulfide reductase, partial [Flavobacteriales bacterium]|nr:TlpA family protein disulfide reductase [Flavobacteriales bacterium]
MNRELLAPLAALLTFGQATAQLNGYTVGQTVNDFTVTDTHGNTHNLYSITASGKHVVIDFFFDTCPPCQQTQPIFNQLHQVYGCNSADLFVISINNGTDNNAAVDAFEATYGGTYRHSPAVGIEGGCAAVDAAFDPVAYPTYCLIGPDNKLKTDDIWPITGVQSYVNAFPAGHNIQTAQCALVGVEERTSAALKGVFPMPASGPVTVDLALDVAGDLRLEVMDALGRTVHGEALGHRPVGTFTHRMDLGMLSNGNYVMRMALDGVPSATHPLMIVR